MTNKYNQEQNQLVKECLFEALIQIMKRKNFYSISITELTQKAGVSRMAFYRNYSIIEDILIESIDNIYNDYGNLLRHNSIEINKMMQLYFQHFRKHQTLINTLLSANLGHLFFSQLIKFMEIFSTEIMCSIECSAEYKLYSSEFLAGGIYQVLMTWCKNGMIENDEEMAILISNSISLHIQTLKDLRM
ncbi:TetR/AcrR family transcriptional regulator [Lactococcus allomyrinae]|uniref:TetR/AcrR family transcriptional regulator n=1 Tax=Lactococcus allomyrinae TaxID=2419773 RepID=A0A387BKW0_9LACT|nr:TetR/AcrR family transcriptional regulator [Lactococcus allomyrinae]AYG01646.1 TetR/AcrR family transcriptional regulator [Lactococcus allomyrinae]